MDCGKRCHQPVRIQRTRHRPLLVELVNIDHTGRVLEASEGRLLGLDMGMAENETIGRMGYKISSPNNRSECSSFPISDDLTSSRYSSLTNPPLVVAKTMCKIWSCQDGQVVTRAKRYCMRWGKREGLDRVDEIIEVRCGAAMRFWKRLIVLLSIFGRGCRGAATGTLAEGSSSESESKLSFCQDALSFVVFVDEDGWEPDRASGKSVGKSLNRDMERRR